ncbi:MAG: P-loop NTPase, partial [Naasia sp.]
MSDSSADLAERVRHSLSAVIDPELRQPITDLGMVGDVSVADDGQAEVQIRLTIVGCPAADRIERDVRAAIATVDEVTAAHVDVTVMTPAERTALTARLRGNRPRGSRFGPESLTRVIAVTSGKGGVGKSTLTANLAVALAARGLAVGLIDADVHGFSIPGILGIDPDSVPTKVGELMLPPVAHGVKTISIGMFLPPAQRGQAIAWRGPMLHRTVAQ